MSALTEIRDRWLPDTSKDAPQVMVTARSPSYGADDIRELLDRYQLAPGAQLRRRLAEVSQAEGHIEQTRENIVGAQAAMINVRLELQQIAGDVGVHTPIPTEETAQRFAVLQARATLLDQRIRDWSALENDLLIDRDNSVNVLNTHFEQWRATVFVLTGIWH